jgi:hypothetical protein
MSKTLVGNFMVEVLCWAFYYVNDGSKVNVNVPQLMRFLVITIVQWLLQFLTKGQDCIMFYFKSDGIITLRKHVDVDHGLIAKRKNANK